MTDSVSRRVAMKKALRAGAYAAPVVLASMSVSGVAAQVTRPPTATTTPTPTTTRLSAVLPNATTTPSPTSTPVGPNLEPCTKVLGGVYNAGIGSGTVTVTQTTTACTSSGYQQRITGAIRAARPGTYTVSAQQNGNGAGGVYVTYGTFSTDASGNATFLFDKTVLIAPANLNIGLALAGFGTQFATDIIPCSVPCGT